MVHDENSSFSEDDSDMILKFARDALETYIKEGQRMDVGSVPETLNRKTASVIKIDSDIGRKVRRGAWGVFDGKKLAECIIECVVTSSSSRTGGGEITKSELRDTVISVAVVENIELTKTPKKDLILGQKMPLVVHENKIEWLFPNQPIENNWSKEEYLRRTYRKAGLGANSWKDSTVILSTVSVFEEKIDKKSENDFKPTL